MEVLIGLVFTGALLYAAANVGGGQPDGQPTAEQEMNLDFALLVLVIAAVFGIYLVGGAA